MHHRRRGDMKMVGKRVIDWALGHNCLKLYQVNVPGQCTKSKIWNEIETPLSRQAIRAYQLHCSCHFPKVPNLTPTVIASFPPHRDRFLPRLLTHSPRTLGVMYIHNHVTCVMRFSDRHTMRSGFLNLA